ncbi:MAG: thioredoxin family protein [Kiritimatiellaceae bacterium]|nr:thioredoxin family protein [Kiritimatiellaceae bacterium]
MNKKWIAIIALIGAVVFMVEHKKRQGFACPPGEKTYPLVKDLSTRTNFLLAPAIKPRLLDIGASHCLPCKMMKPILADLHSQFSNQFETIHIDSSQQMETAQAYQIRVIPTQIFYNAEGKELFRHEGFMSKDDILAKWKELGITP